jgi:hypothetical protein
MHVQIINPFEAMKLSPAPARRSFAALGDAQHRSAGARKLPANDEFAGEWNISQDRLEVGAASRAKHFGDVEKPSVLTRRRSVLVGGCRFARLTLSSGERANQSPEPTVMSVTPRAGARVAPATTVAHL